MIAAPPLPHGTGAAGLEAGICVRDELTPVDQRRAGVLNGCAIGPKLDWRTRASLQPEGWDGA